VEWFLGDPLSNLCSVIPISNQDGHLAQNRKKGGSYVKLSSAVVAILVGGLKCRTHFWKGTTQGSFEQSLVEIGSVVSEEKIFFKFHKIFSSETTAPIATKLWCSGPCIAAFQTCVR
jgi:hypothetical protein